MQFSGTGRLWVALVAYAVLALLALATISDERIRWVTWAVLAMFAVRTLVHSGMMEGSKAGSERE